MKLRKLRLLAVFGLLALPLLGFLLPKRTQASSPVPVDVVNKPTVQVGNTPNVNVANQVGISSMPDVQISGGSVNIANGLTSPVNVIAPADLYPIEASGQCNFPAGSSQCTQDGLYAVPAGYHAVITDSTGACTIEGVTLSSAQLLATWSGNPVSFTSEVVNGPGFGAYFAGWSTIGARFYADAGTSISFVATAASATQNSFCSYTIAGYLVPITASSSIGLRVRGVSRR
jgi:hypothetical protein